MYALRLVARRLTARRCGAIARRAHRLAPANSAHEPAASYMRRSVGSDSTSFASTSTAIASPASAARSCSSRSA